MKSIPVLLNTIEKVKLFVNAVNKFDTPMELSSDNGVVDAKSILGVLSLNILNSLILTIHGDALEQSRIVHGIQEYVCLN